MPDRFYRTPDNVYGYVVYASGCTGMWNFEEMREAEVSNGHNYYSPQRIADAYTEYPIEYAIPPYLRVSEGL